MMMRSALSKVKLVGRATVFMVLVALLALFVAASGTAVAAVNYFTSLDGTITACRDNKTGLLRVIDIGQSCTTSKETPITWKDGITGKVADSDKLDGKDSSAFAAKAEAPAAAEDSITNAPIYVVNLFTSLDSVTVTAPADGFVIVTASGNFVSDNTTTPNSQQDIVACLWTPPLNTPNDNCDKTAYAEWRVPAGMPPSVYVSPFSITKMYPVQAGNQTFYLRGYTAGDGASSIGQLNLTAHYVKNRF